MIFKYPYGATPIDANELQDLIPDYISLQKELNEFEQVNIISAVSKYSVRNFSYEDILDFHFILQVHKDMFDKTWRWAGKTRHTLKNIGVPVEKIFEETKILLDDAHFWIAKEIYLPDEIGARFHHRLVSIHLFPNGNGRHARFIVDLLMKSIGNELFTWGRKDLYYQGEARNSYINALKKADSGNYNLLLEFVRS